MSPHFPAFTNLGAGGTYLPLLRIYSGFKTFWGWIYIGTGCRLMRHLTLDGEKAEELTKSTK